MNKSLEKILPKLDTYKIIGPKETSVRGITFDSRKVKKDFAFFAVKGARFDGHNFIPQAIKNGASVIITEKKVKTAGKITYVRVKDNRLALARTASYWYGNPSKKLTVIGVTGTDGKTTTANFIYEILKTSGKKVGLISTVKAVIGRKSYETGLHVTSPDPITLNKFLDEMVNKDLNHAVIEVTSHAIDQKRVEGVSFDIGVLTNITHEHTDYHGSFKEYRDVKISFLRKCKKVVLNKDDSSFKYVAQKLKGADIYTYSLLKKADFQAKNAKEVRNGSSFTVSENLSSQKIETNFLGEYNLANAMAAISTSRLLKVPYSSIKKVLRSIKLPPGRLEKLEFGQDFEIIVDFAHTPNALESTLKYLKKKSKGKLISVFGCAGERDKKKRYMMGKISAKLADISVFTAEDPRSEDIQEIFVQMVKGAQDAGAKEGDIGGEIILKREEHVFMKIPERFEAIFYAVQKLAKPEDVLVICGKGHEKSMAYNSTEHPWSDKEAIKMAIQADRSQTAIVLAAGEGTRMKSGVPKILRKIAGRPMIAYTLQNLREARIGNIVVVIGYKKRDVKDFLRGATTFATQDKPLGTGHATKRGLAKVKYGKEVLVLNGDDSFFYKPETINKVLSSHKTKDAKVTFVTLIRQDPEGLGRIVRDKKGNLLAIVEEKDATDTQRKIKEVNDGLYVFNRVWLEKNLPKVQKSHVSGEYYLVDLIEIALGQKDEVNVYRLKDSSEWLGVNTQEHLRQAEQRMNKNLKDILEND